MRGNEEKREKQERATEEASWTNGYCLSRGGSGN